MSDHLFAQGDAAKLPLPDAGVDLVIGSPPYVDARLYLEDGIDLGISRDQFEWVDWMLEVTEEALRVTRGAVIWVCAGVTRDRNYWPACEGLLWEGHKRGLLSECPVYWHRNGISGSGGSQWFRKDVEYCLAFKRAEVIPGAQNTACGTPPKYGAGGAMSHRTKDGARVHTKRRRDGSMEVQRYDPPPLSNPGTLLVTQEADEIATSSVFRTLVGGGHLGHPIAHDNEAPYPEAVPEFFIRSLCDVGGIVLDPFSGSGTTVAAAARLGRRGIGFDLRLSQCRLGGRRLERPHAPVAKTRAADEVLPLFGATS